MVVEDDRNLYCVDSKNALAAYIKYGLEPGSFCKQLLIGNTQQAYHHAHPHLKPHLEKHPYLRMTTDVVANMQRFVNVHVPACARGAKNYARWTRIGGLQGTKELDLALVEWKLQEYVPWWDRVL